MEDKLKEILVNQKQLQELLGIGRIQAWRLWTGKSKLTAINEKYLRLVLQDESQSKKKIAG